MADSAALRKRRSRAHGSGDHSLCRDPAACEAAAATPITDAVREQVGSLALRPGDPRGAMAALAEDLAARWDAGKLPPSHLAQLRQLLDWLAGETSAAPPVAPVTDAELQALFDEEES